MTFLILSVFTLITVGGILLVLRLRRRSSSLSAQTPTSEPTSPIAPAPIPTRSWSDRLSKGLERSRSDIWGKLSGLIRGTSLSDDEIESIEELLYGADIGPEMVAVLIDYLKSHKGETTPELLKEELRHILTEKLASIQTVLPDRLFAFHADAPKETRVIMVAGVNGAGKTTTIGKLATKLTQQGASVMVGACDTFRAAAVDQLQVWCERAGAHMIRAKDGADPSGVAYEALAKARESKADYCIIDTAGRLHTKENLMEELRKLKRVMTKLDESAPHDVLLVIDAVTGQNAIKQAQEFHKALGVTALVFTKCDGSSKAGSAIGIMHNLKLPVAYIGVGEDVEDLDRFELDAYLRALLDIH